MTLTNTRKRNGTRYEIHAFLYCYLSACGWQVTRHDRDFFNKTAAAPVFLIASPGRALLKVARLNWAKFFFFSLAGDDIFHGKHKVSSPSEGESWSWSWSWSRSRRLAWPQDNRTAPPRCFACLPLPFYFVSLRVLNQHLRWREGRVEGEHLLMCIPQARQVHYGVFCFLLTAPLFWEAICLLRGK